MSSARCSKHADNEVDETYEDDFEKFIEEIVNEEGDSEDDEEFLKNHGFISSDNAKNNDVRKFQRKFGLKIKLFLSGKFCDTPNKPHDNPIHFSLARK
jgi:hypothetical protein